MSKQIVKNGKYYWHDNAGLNSFVYVDSNTHPSFNGIRGEKGWYRPPQTSDMCRSLTQGPELYSRESDGVIGHRHDLDASYFTDEDGVCRPELKEQGLISFCYDPGGHVVNRYKEGSTDKDGNYELREFKLPDSIRYTFDSYRQLREEYKPVLVHLTQMYPGHQVALEADPTSWTYTDGECGYMKTENRGMADWYVRPTMWGILPDSGKTHEVYDTTDFQDSMVDGDVCGVITGDSD